MRKCKKCAVEKPKSEFHSKGMGQYDWVCRVCRCSIDREKYLEGRSPEAQARILRHREARQEDPAIREQRRQQKRREHLQKLTGFRKERLLALKRGKPCVDCGGIFHVQAMEFDHRERKKFGISEGVSKHPLELVLKEVTKCDLVCANCHRVRTARRRQGLPAVLPEPEYFI